MLRRLVLGLMLALCFGIESEPAVAGVQLFTNNAVTTLAAPASNSATTLTVSSSSLFPSPTGGNWFIATLEHIVSGVVTVNEIVKVTNVSGTTWTVVRAQEGTSAVAWLSGDTVALLPTAGGLAQFAQPGLVNGDCTVNSSFAITCTKTSGTAFGTGATARFSYGPIYQSGNVTCVIESPSGNGQSANLASVSCSSVGDVTINFSTPYTTNPPLCTTTIYSQPSMTAVIANLTTSSVTVYTYQGNSLINGVEYSISCLGT